MLTLMRTKESMMAVNVCSSASAMPSQILSSVLCFIAEEKLRGPAREAWTPGSLGVCAADDAVDPCCPRNKKMGYGRI